MKAEQQIEKMMKKQNREPFYNYYLSLGYDHKTAACLALFTYGEYRFRKFSMDDLYDALAHGKAYLPPEVLKETNESRFQRLFGGPSYACSSGTGFGPCAPSAAPAEPSGACEKKSVNM